VWKPARLQALRERDGLQALAAELGDNIDIAAWDWRYYAEKRRRQEFDLDEAELKPYLQLDKIIEAAFDTAGRLFGITFTERKDVPVYHPDVRAFEAKDRDGNSVGLFYGDYFNRSSKRSGAWMSAFRSQEKLNGDIKPIIVNVMNFSRGSDGQPALLSFDDARTLFHELGHGLHGLLSDVTYPLLSGTGVVRDFVEFPSQLYEHWLEQPQVLQRYAVHYRTGEPMPKALLDRLLASRTFNQGRW
jgi:peptidyl-dipeptidase Dcp